MLVDVRTAGAYPSETVMRLQGGQPQLRPIFMARGAELDLARKLWLLPLMRKPIGVRTLLRMIRITLDGG